MSQRPMSHRAGNDPAAANHSMIRMKGVSKVYRTEHVETHALSGIHLEIKDGEYVSIAGPSGCGKSTFLNAVTGLLPINAGRLLLKGQPITKPGRDRAQVFQAPQLLPWRTGSSSSAVGRGGCGRRSGSTSPAHAICPSSGRPNSWRMKTTSGS